MLRLIALLGGLAAALNLGVGAPIEESVKRAVVTVRLARTAGCPDDEIRRAAPSRTQKSQLHSLPSNGPIVLGAVAQSAGIGYAMLAGASVGLSGAVWMWWLRSRSKGSGNGTLAS